MRCFTLPCVALAALILAGITPTAQAQEDRAPVRVQRVNFNNNVNPTKDSNIVIQLRAQSQPDPEAINKDYVDNIRVVATLGYSPGGVSRDDVENLVFYRSEVEIATLKINDNRSLAFWLPYDIVTRDRYNREADYWIIEIFVNGEQVPPNRDQVSRSLLRGNDPAANLAGFKGLAEGKITQTDGILRPTYLTINNDVERPDKILPYIRKQADEQ